MKIVKLTAENFKKLVAVEIAPDGNIVTLTGKNGAGKSSILDAIAIALCGGRKGDSLLRTGQEKGKVSVDLGEFSVTRTFTDSADYLKVSTKDGFEKKSPQKFLDGIVGKISFDPMNFYTSEPVDQKKILMDLAGVNVETLDAEYAKLYESRTVENRFLKSEEAAHDSIIVPDGAPLEEVSPAVFMDRLNEANAHNTAIDDLEKEFSSGKETLETLKQELKHAQEAVKKLEERIEKGTSYLDEKLKKIDESERIDISEIRTALDTAEKQNEAARALKQKTAAAEKVTERKKSVETIEKKLNTITEAKAKALNEGKFPIPGLSFNEKGVLFGGLPLENASGAERIRVALAISMALNPTLRVLRITDGSLLDSSSWKVISEMAADKDFQVWIEKVDESGEIGVYIEDGSVKTKADTKAQISQRRAA